MYNRKKIIILIILFIVSNIISYELGYKKTIKHLIDDLNISTSDVDNKKIISKEEFRKHIRKVELTEDNWREYLQLNETTRETKNAFDEIITREKYMTLSLKDEYIGQLGGVALKFRLNKEKIKQPYYSLRPEYDIICDFLVQNEVNLISDSVVDISQITNEDFTLIQVKGELYYLQDIPKDLIEYNDYEDFLIKIDNNGEIESYTGLIGNDRKKLKDLYEEGI